MLSINAGVVVPPLHIPFASIGIVNLDELVPIEIVCRGNLARVKAPTTARSFTEGTDMQKKIKYSIFDQQIELFKHSCSIRNRMFAYLQCIVLLQHQPVIFFIFSQDGDQTGGLTTLDIVWLTQHHHSTIVQKHAYH